MYMDRFLRLTWPKSGGFSNGTNFEDRSLSGDPVARLEIKILHTAKSLKIKNHCAQKGWAIIIYVVGM